MTVYVEPEPEKEDYVVYDRSKDAIGTFQAHFETRIWLLISSCSSGCRNATAAPI